MVNIKRRLGPKVTISGISTGIPVHTPDRPVVTIWGREQEIDALYDTLADHDLVLIDGIAGVGKTTLGQGLAAKIAYEGLPLASEYSGEIPTERTQLESRQHSVTGVHRLVISAFTVAELRRFCRDRPILRPICNLFSPRDGLVDLADKTVEFCETHYLLGELLAEIEQHNPGMFEHFRGSLYGSLSPVFETASPEDVRQIWIDCRSDTNLEALVTRLAWHLQMRYQDGKLLGFLEEYPTSDSGAWINVLDDTLRQDLYLFFLDDFHLIRDQVILTELIPRLVRCVKMVMLTRETTPVLRALKDQLIRVTSESQLRGLSEEASLSLLRERGLSDCVEENLRELIQKVEGHPQALVVCAGLVREGGLPLKDLLEIPLYHVGADRPLEGLLQEADQRLSRRERRLITICSVFDQPFPEQALQHLWEKSDWQEVTTALLDRFLLSEIDGVFTLHPLVREYFYNRLPKRRKIHRLAAIYFESLRSEREDEHMQNSIAAHYHAWAASEFVLAARITSRIGSLLFNRGHYHQLMNLVEGTVETVRCPDPWLHVYRARILDAWGRFGEAEASLLEACGVYDKGIRLLLFQELGNMLSSRGEYERAETFYQRSLAICRKLENLNLQVIILYGLWINCQAQGENGACKQFYSEIVDVLGEDIGPLHSLVWGRICERTGDHDQAIQYYTAVLQYGRQHGDLRLAAQASYRLGWVHLELENNDSSSEYLEQGLSAAQEAREMVLVADCLSALGQVQFYGKKDHARARKCLDESLAVSEELGDKRRIAKCLWHLARWEETTGSMTKARILIGEALALAQQLRMEPQVAEIRSDWLRIRDKYLGRDDTILLSGDGTDTHSHEIIVNESG